MTGAAFGAMKVKIAIGGAGCSPPADHARGAALGEYKKAGLEVELDRLQGRLAESEAHGPRLYDADVSWHRASPGFYGPFQGRTRTVLAEPHIAALSVYAGDKRGPLTVPIWYQYTPGGEPWVLTGVGSRKHRLIEAAGHPDA